MHMVQVGGGGGGMARAAILSHTHTMWDGSRPQAPGSWSRLGGCKDDGNTTAYPMHPS